MTILPTLLRRASNSTTKTATLLRLKLQSHQSRLSTTFLTAYDDIVEERAKIGIVPKPLDKHQVASVIDELKDDSIAADDKTKLKELLTHRVPPGVDEAAYVKASWLTELATGKETCPEISRKDAVTLLGTMQGGYNVATLVDMLTNDSEELAQEAADALKKTLLVFDGFYDVEKLAHAGNAYAMEVLQSWANAEWFLTRPPVPEQITVTVFKVTGETNTDDLSPAPDAWSRPDIPLHAMAMLKNEREGIVPDQPGEVGPVKQIAELLAKGHPLAYVGDVVGTGSSRKSATNSVLWYMGSDLDYVPNMKGGGVCIGSKIAPIFYNTMEDSGALPLEMPVEDLHMGDVVTILPYEGRAMREDGTTVVCEFAVKSAVLFDEVRAGGRIPLIIGRGITAKARESLGLEDGTDDNDNVFEVPGDSTSTAKGYTLAQKMVGKACGVEGVLPDTYCEPKMTTVGSQDTTGPMTRDELRSLACLGFSADLVMQSFCHTSAYPKPVDVVTHATLPDFIRTRGGVSLRPGDGIIHSWLNRMLIPDTVGTGGDSHTRFPVGISFPAGSGLVAFAGATGTMPLDMPESVLVRFSGDMQPGVTLRDLVQAIPYYAKQEGLLTLDKANKKNIFSGRILEIEGLPDLKCEQAFELSDASAERSAAGCTIQLNEEPVIEYLQSNIVMLKWMIAEGYGSVQSLERRIGRMEQWLENPVLMKADKDAEYAATIEIDLNDLKEPILACPNDPDDSKLLSEVAGTDIDEVRLKLKLNNLVLFSCWLYVYANESLYCV